MKTDIHKSKLFCIQDTAFSYCDFKKNNIYNISYTDQVITIYDHNNQTFDFHPNSPFNISIKMRFFTNLSEIRKQKLKKILNGSNL